LAKTTVVGYRSAKISGLGSFWHNGQTNGHMEILTTASTVLA